MSGLRIALLLDAWSAPEQTGVIRWLSPSSSLTLLLWDLVFGIA
jgi:hypothetical protein